MIRTRDTSAGRLTPGKTRTCPHCKATILESATVCPGCKGHLRFGTDAQRAVEAQSAMRVEGTILPRDGELSEYSIVIVVNDERGAQVARHIVNVGALQGADKRTFSLSVDMYPVRGAAGSGAKR